MTVVQALAETIAETPTAAWEPSTIDAAARLNRLSLDFQRLLDAVKRGGGRVRDWRAAVDARRDEIDRELPELGEDADPWRIGIANRLLTDGKGLARRVVANVITIFVHDPRWSGRLAFHAMSEAPVIVTPIEWHPDDAPPRPESGPWSEADTVRATSWLAREWALDVPSAMVMEAILAVSKRIEVDPLRDYLESRRNAWDGTLRLEGWLSRYLGAPDTPYARAIGKRWLISAVARALRPGCKVDCVLVLESREQGTGKSAALRALAPLDELFFDDDLALGTKDAAQSIASKWLIELGEIDKLSRHELGIMKAFITRQTDHYRPSYARAARDFPRHCVFAGSTNETEYLRDEENRRFWPVRTGRIDLVALVRDRDQLWSEAVEAFDGGHPWHVDTPELAALCRSEQEKRAQGDPWDEHVMLWLSGQTDKADRECQARIMGRRDCGCILCCGTTTSGVLSAACGVEKAKQTKSEEMRVAAILRRLGWVRGEQERQSGSRVRPYFPPLKDTTKSEEATSAHQ